MGKLSDRYIAVRGEAADGPELEAALAAACARGRSAHPTFVVSDEDFAAHLGRCGASVSERSGPAALCAEDLYLACACLSGDERATALLVATYKPVLVSAIERIDPAPAFVDDMQQRFWDSVLVGTMSTPPRLGTYSGLGSLGGWMAVGAQRVALMMKRHEQAEGRARRFENAAGAPLVDPELAFIKERYRDQFQAATQKALETLDDRERMIFRLHLVDGITIERIGRLYGVSHSTISRWFASARDKVVTEAQRVIRDELHLSSGEFDSLKRLVVSQLDVSLSLLPKPDA